MKLAINGKLQSENDLRDIIIRRPFGGKVKSGDIADVKSEYTEPQTDGFRVDGKPFRWNPTPL